MNIKPILVSGVGRSGTSAVLSSLYTHKSIIDIPRIGEAPLITSFLNFLVDYEDNSPAAEYNKKNYRLDDIERKKSIAEFLMINQCGISVEEMERRCGEYWITKTSLTEESFDKAVEVFGELRCVYIMRNGIEVINSARKFSGFRELSFAQQCNRWKQNLVECNYLRDRPLCCTIKHDELVKNPEVVFSNVFESLGLDGDKSPSRWISENIFNSSFDSTSKSTATSSAFDNRLANAWSDWSDVEKNEFMELCDDTMQKYNFVRPYETKNSSCAPLLIPTKVEAAKKIEITREDSFSDEALVLCKEKFSKEILNYICNISEKHNYLYVNNAKVASTSILKTLQLLEDKEAVAKMSSPHDRANSPLRKISHFNHNQQREILLDGDVERFTFVRNPFERMLSAYMSKIAKPLRGYKFDPANPNFVPPKAKIIELYTGESVSDLTDFAMEIDFQTFVELVCGQECQDMDPHWTPQYDLLMVEQLKYSFIGRFENLTSDINVLMGRLNISDFSAPGYSKNRTDSSRLLKQYYSKYTRNLVINRYSKDFDYFNYNTEMEIQSQVAV